MRERCDEKDERKEERDDGQRESARERDVGREMIGKDVAGPGQRFSEMTMTWERLRRRADREIMERWRREREREMRPSVSERR